MRSFFSSTDEGGLGALPASSARLQWIEALRWVAAAAVVFQHALEKLCLQAIAEGSPSSAWFIHAAIRFPVPVFFFLSGLAAGLGLLAGRDTTPLRRALRTAVPYVVYSLLYTLLALATGRLAGLSLARIAASFVFADNASILWFLASLTVVAPVSVLLWKRWLKRFAVVAIALSLLASCLYSYSVVWTSLPSTLARMVVVPMGLYAAGLWWSNRRASASRPGAGGAVLLLAGVFLTLSVVEMYVAEFVLEPHWRLTQQWYATLTVGAACLCIGLDLVADAAWFKAPARLLSGLPRVTLGVYCLHILFLAYVPILEVAQMKSTAWALVAGVVALVASTLAAAVASRVWVLRPLVT